jgi:hypothetical protein
MATAFPTNLDTLTNPVATDNTVTVSHAGQHANANDAIEALEAKVGKNSSAVTTSHDYKLSEVTSTDKAVGKTATQDITNKNLGVGTKITIGSDATGDIWYRHSDGTIKRLAVSTDGKILKLASGVPSWATETITEDASTTVKGVVEEATLAEIDANTAAGDTGARLFVNPSTLGKTIDGTFADNSDAKIPSQKAIKTYVDGAYGAYVGGITTEAGSSTHNTDTVFTVGFPAKSIEIWFKINGESNNGGQMYSKGVAYYNGTTHVLTHWDFKNNASATPTITGATRVFDTDVPTVGVAAGGNSMVVALSVLSISATQVTIRASYTEQGTDTGNSSYFIVVK